MRAKRRLGAFPRSNKLIEGSVGRVAPRNGEIIADQHRDRGSALLRFKVENGVYLDTKYKAYRDRTGRFVKLQEMVE